MLVLENVCYDIALFRIIDSFNLRLNEGEIVALFGRSGCGKTTILNLIASFLDITSGVIDDKSNSISFVFQDSVLLPFKTALQNILIVNKKCDVDSIFALADRFELTQKDIMRYPHELSGGQRQRVNFIRAIVADSSIFLLDEAFSNLNFEIKNIMIDFFVEFIKKNRKCAIVVTHDRFEAIKIADYIYFLESKAKINEILEVDNREQMLSNLTSIFSPKRI